MLEMGGMKMLDERLSVALQAGCGCLLVLVVISGLVLTVASLVGAM